MIEIDSIIDNLIFTYFRKNKKMDSKKVITNEIFEDYLNCKYKSFLRLSNHVGDKAEFEIFQKGMENAYCSIAQNKFMTRYNNGDVLFIPYLKQSDLKRNKGLILQTWVDVGELISFFHALKVYSEKIESDTSYYMPVLYCHHERITRTHKLILAFKAFVIGQLQGKLPDKGIIINGKNYSAKTISLKTYFNLVYKIINELKEQLSNSDGIPLILNSHCDICEFKTLCQKKAIEEDNISLLRGISEKEIHKHNQRGIFTLNQLSYTFRPRKIPKRAKNPAQPHYFALQALSLRKNKIYIHGDPRIPTADTKIYFDIEGVPYRNLYYLIGFIEESEKALNFHYNWADSEEDEIEIFSLFVKHISQLKNYQLFHFGAYDVRALKKIKSNLDENLHKPLETLIDQSVNILSIIHSKVYFPTYSNDLKNIAKVLGYKWSDKKASGVQSIIWREIWEKNREPALKAKLIQYNKEDCFALKKICDFITNAVTFEKRDIIKNGRELKVSDTDGLKSDSRKRYVFKKQEFIFEDLAYINKCAYFDYQREKVFVRTNEEFKKINKRKLKKNIWITYKYKPNKIKKIEFSQCIFCRSKNLEKGDEIVRFLIDIKFFSGGIKKWITQYLSWHYKCNDCKRIIVNKNIPSYRERYGHGLISWCVYINVARKQSMLQVGHILGDVLDLHIEPTKLHRFKSSIAKFYKRMYEDILSEILKGKIIHIDETRVNLQKKKGYVWVITSMDKVYYFYKENRKGDFLKDMLETFSGVLISDLYRAYDSVDNPQQKCIVHLIRDMNEDLMRNPFDSEFKNILELFSIILREIITTVDKFGLKKRFLHKHWKKVNKFLEYLDNSEIASDTAKKYQKRFKKYGKRFFTFLDYDGVPWNNCNAESAIRFFAKHRRFADGRFTERSLNDFLVILSVFQTCEFNQINVMKFLLSKETNVKKLLRN